MYTTSVRIRYNMIGETAYLNAAFSTETKVTAKKVAISLLGDPTEYIAEVIESVESSRDPSTFKWQLVGFV